MKRWMDPTRFRRCRGGALALLLAPACALAHAPAVNFANFALGAKSGAVSVKVDGTVVRDSIDYRGYSSRLPIAAGERLVVVTTGDGAPVTSHWITFASDDVVTLFLAGEGSERAPYELRVSIDHNLPFEPGVRIEQIANLALPASSAEAVPPVYAQTRCSEAQPISPIALAYGDGAAPVDAEDWHINSGRMSRGSIGQCPLWLGASSDGSGATAFDLRDQEGARRRVVYAGDGVTRPLEAVVIVQSIEPVVTVLEHSVAFDGLWYDPAVPGSGFLLAFDAEQARMNALTFGFDPDNRAVWRRFDGAELQRVVGGTPDGTRGTQAFPIMPARILIHSCSSATLIPLVGASEYGIRGGQHPRQAIRLHKLLPVGGCVVRGIG